MINTLLAWAALAVVVILVLIVGKDDTFWDDEE